MPQNPQEILRSHWPWLSAEYIKLDDNMRELMSTLRNAEASNEERETALISASQLLCGTLRSCKQRDLFQALVDDVKTLPTSQLMSLQRQIHEHLDRILELEEGILIMAGMPPTTAKDLRHTLASLPRSTWQPTQFIDESLDHYALLATDVICNKFPKSSFDFKTKSIKESLGTLKKKHGFVAGLTVAAANLTVAYLVPEPMTVTKASKLLGIGLSLDSKGDG